MRLTLLAAVVTVIACSPKPMPTQSVDDEVTAGQKPALKNAPLDGASIEAPPGRGIRKGTIERTKLVAVLKNGPGAFLSQVEVAPQLEGKRFVGWQLVRLLDRNSPLADVDVAPGDVLVAVNGNSLSKPEQLQTLWDSLHKANSLNAVLHRGGTQVQLAFAIEPSVR